jgi:hypothetical protein
MRLIAPALLSLVAAGCADLRSSLLNADSWNVDEAAVMNGTDPKLRLGMPIGDAMRCLEENGFKRGTNAMRDYRRDDEGSNLPNTRPSFEFKKTVEGWPWELSALFRDTEVWLYYDAGKLIDIRVRQMNTGV